MASGLLVLSLESESGLSSSTIDLLSKSKILMHEAVAAHNQYLLGEKTKALTMSPASKEYKCLPSFKSQSMVIPSLPPEAAKEPSGETERVLMIQCVRGGWS